MPERKKIALLFLYDEQWMGGTYYVLNLIEALKTIDDSQKPFLKIIVTTANEEAIIRNLNYPYFEIVFDNKAGISFFKRGVNFLAKKLLKQHLFKSYPAISDCVAVFPVFSAHIRYYTTPFYWIPDFQELYYPGFFSAREILRRISHHKKIASKKCHVVFSSHDACNSFNTFYPDHLSKKHVLHFAVTHPSYHMLKQEDLRVTYRLPKDYFIAPNQFWKHKNHRVVIEAAKLLKTEGRKPCIVFTGKENDNRNPEYAKELKKLVEDNNLENEIRFLGFIDRAHLLQLMKNALAVIQPSLFEGWSTVIEDAKAMNQFIIASAIDVNIEQLAGAGLVFNPLSAADLSEKMILVLSEKTLNTGTIDYEKNVLAFGTQFLKLID